MLRLKGQELGYYDTNLGIAILVFSNIIVLSSAIFWISEKLIIIDSKERYAKKELILVNNELSNYKISLDKAALVTITDQNGIIKNVNDKFCEI